MSENKNSKNATSDTAREYNRKYQHTYRKNSPDKHRACLLRYYIKQLTAEGYTVIPAAPGTVTTC